MIVLSSVNADFYAVRQCMCLCLHVVRIVHLGLQAWRAVYPPRQGTPLLGTRPYVHAGFLRSWRKESINDGVVSRVQRVVSAMEAKGRRVRVLVTGASPASCMLYESQSDWVSQLACLPRYS